MKMLTFLLAALCIAGCQSSGKVDRDADLQALKTTAARYQANVMASDFDEVKKFYLGTARAMPPDLETIQGTDSLGKFMDGFKTVKNLTATFSEPEVVMASGGDMGYSIATATLSWEDANGKTTSENLRDVHIWVRQPDGSWKIELDIWNEVETGEDDDGNQDKD